MNKFGDDMFLVFVILNWVSLFVLVWFGVWVLVCVLNMLGESVVVVLVLIISDWIIGWYKFFGIGIIIVVVFLLLVMFLFEVGEFIFGKLSVSEYVMNVFLMLLVE